MKSRSRSPRRSIHWTAGKTLGSGTSAEVFQVESHTPQKKVCALRVLNSAARKDRQWQEDFRSQMALSEYFSLSSDPKENVHPKIIGCDEGRGNCLMTCGEALNTYLKSTLDVPSQDQALPHSLIQKLKKIACAGFLNADVKPLNTVIMTDGTDRFIQIIDIDLNHCLYLDPVLQTTLNADGCDSTKVCKVIRVLNYFSMLYLFLNHIKYYSPNGPRRQLFSNVLEEEMRSASAYLQPHMGHNLHLHIKKVCTLMNELQATCNRQELIRRGVRLCDLTKFKENAFDLGDIEDEDYFHDSQFLWILCSMASFYFNRPGMKYNFLHLQESLCPQDPLGGELELLNSFCPPKSVLNLKDSSRVNPCYEELSDIKMQMPVLCHLESDGKGLWTQTKI